MKKNIGHTDKTIRFIIAFVLIVLYVTKTLTGTLATVGLVVAAALIITSFLNFCGLYSIFGITTCKVK